MTSRRDTARAIARLAGKAVMYLAVVLAAAALATLFIWIMQAGPAAPATCPRPAGPAAGPTPAPECVTTRRTR